jgi:hypothetical protein
MILGGTLADDEPWSQILKGLDLPHHLEVSKFLGALNAAGEAAGVRTLIAIDALNEKNGQAIWPERSRSPLSSPRLTRSSWTTSTSRGDFQRHRRGSSRIRTRRGRRFGRGVKHRPRRFRPGPGVYRSARQPIPHAHSSTLASSVCARVADARPRRFRLCPPRPFCRDWNRQTDGNPQPSILRG